MINLCWVRRPPSSALLLSPKSLSLLWESDLSSNVGSRCSFVGIVMKVVSFEGLHSAVCAFAHPIGLLVAAMSVSRSQVTPHKKETLGLTIGVEAFRYSEKSFKDRGYSDQLCSPDKKVYIVTNAM